MQNLNTALHEGGFYLNIKSDYKFKYPIVIYNYFTGVLKNKIIIKFIKIAPSSIKKYNLILSNLFFIQLALGPIAIKIKKITTTGKIIAL